MAKQSGSTKTSTSRNPKGISESPSNRITSVNMPKMYDSVEANYNGERIRINHVKAGYGGGGFFNVVNITQNEPIYRVGYGSQGMARREYLTARDAWNDVKRRFK